MCVTRINRTSGGAPGLLSVLLHVHTPPACFCACRFDVMASPTRMLQYPPMSASLYRDVSEKEEEAQAGGQLSG